jgi:hypothetical protein
MTPIRLSNAERRRWRDKCRSRLSEHVGKNAYFQVRILVDGLSGQTLGIVIEPSKIRLLPRDDDPYCWKWLPETKHLFSKNLSDHSTGAYKKLFKEVGVTFEAAPVERITAKSTTTPDTMISLNVSSKPKA